KIMIFNIIGQEVGVIFDQDVPVGNFRTAWDGHNRFGDMVGNAPYFIVIKTPSVQMVRQVIVLK
ncbi:MAG TPA: hypothetical protein VIJ93_01655, partial [bacterium]